MLELPRIVRSLDVLAGVGAGTSARAASEAFWARGQDPARRHRWVALGLTNHSSVAA